MKTLWTTFRSLIYSSLFILLWGWVASMFRPYDSRLGGPLPPWAAALGWLSIALGAGLAASCVWTFIVRGQGTPAPFDAPRQVVARGPYRVIRNPMYVGGFLVLLGYGLVQLSTAIVLFALAWIVFVHLMVVAAEEPDLRRKFGASYDDYRRAVPRWIPRLRGL